jgi:hypothetical protein
MASPEPDYATVLDENSYTKNLFEAAELVQRYRQMSGDYDIDDFVCEGCGRHLPCRHCEE